MPDPSVSDALAEAYALAPADEVILHTVEIRHPAFVDDAGNEDSIWVVADQKDFVGTLEADAPVKGGQQVTFTGLPFSFALAPIEPGVTPEMEASVDNVSREITEQLDLAVADGSPIDMVYRPYLASDPTEPQMDPPPAFELNDVAVNAVTIRARARIGIDLRVAFPRRTYTAREFPGLINS